MKPKQFGASATPFKFDLENSIELETSKSRQKNRRSRRGKTSLAIIIVAALVLISDGILVSVYLHRVNERKNILYTTPQHIEIKSFSYNKTEQIVSDVYPKPLIKLHPVREDRPRNQIKEEKIQIYSWIDEKGVKHYSDTTPSVQVEKPSDRSLK